jgi:beta-xylosidase
MKDRKIASEIMPGWSLAPRGAASATKRGSFFCPPSFCLWNFLLDDLTIPFLAAMILSSGCQSGNADRQNAVRTYNNPLYCADYPDPDVIRVGKDFYMVTSSFTYSPGLPIYHSNDLVHWRQIANIVDGRKEEFFDVPQHGNGIWAPSIRYHDGYFHVFFGDPDFGIFMTKAKNPAGPWEPLALVAEGKGRIDPCPFWDDDGKAYLVHAWAKSRAGFNSILTMYRMSSEGDRLLDEGTPIFDGTETQPTIEGPKMYKRNGYYYIFAPAGGVRSGWQTVLRSENVFGPYDVRIVMHQGATDINGPHQGGWVELESGEHWFIHFQDRLAYGRVLHLNPMEWLDDGWPIIGIDKNGDGIGEPVRSFRYPSCDSQPSADGLGTGNAIRFISQQTSDEFESPRLSLQWRWQANYREEWFSLTANPGCLRLNSLPVDDTNLWNVPQVITQKFPAEEFEIVTKVRVNNLRDGDMTGIAATGSDYATLQVTRIDGERSIAYVVCKNANQGAECSTIKELALSADTVYLKMEVTKGAVCAFSFGTNGEDYMLMGSGFEAKALRWVGASIGLYCFARHSRDASGAGGPARQAQRRGYADFEWFRVTYQESNI